MTSIDDSIARLLDLVDGALDDEHIALPAHARVRFRRRLTELVHLDRIEITRRPPDGAQ